MTEREELLEMLAREEREELLAFGRDEDHKWSTCIDCEVLFVRCGRSERCRTCNSKRCSHCGSAKDEFSPHRWCHDCLAAKTRARYQGEGRSCRDCNAGLPSERKDVLCTDCRRQHMTIQYRKAQRTRPARACADCKTMMPAGRWLPRCTDCQNEWLRRRRAELKRSCKCCETRSTFHSTGYCDHCRKVMMRSKNSSFGTA